ncbi:hypothetical protein [uncultured Ruthenibacterium sp.]|uniref:hypothetical protein n=1 Tax=uncultured Ruthenibacterium sp. TaxID=1905347 RepID=UPI00349EF9AD
MTNVTILELVTGFAIALALMVTEYLLCTKMKNPLWGGIIPCLILVGTIWIFSSGTVPLEMQYVFPFIILNTLFFGDWGTGRDKYKKLQQKEMERMKAKDM